MEDRAERVKNYRDAVTSRLAMGVLKIDFAVVAVSPESPITGEERVSRSTLHHEVATEALKIHDELMAAGEIQPNPTVRAHILRVIELSADPVKAE